MKRIISQFLMGNSNRSFWDIDKYHHSKWSDLNLPRTGYQAAIVSELFRLKTSVACLPETRVNDSGKCTVEIPHIPALEQEKKHQNLLCKVPSDAFRGPKV